MDALLALYIRFTFTPRDDRGEGVISAAIAVLIMAFLGVVVWVGFKATLDNTQEKIDQQVEEIGK
ncbi:MAG TPA: hypothetical protein VF230_06130 [Acidimicrobiales bacterium]